MIDSASEAELSEIERRAALAFAAAMEAHDCGDNENFLRYKAQHQTVIAQYIRLKSGDALAEQFLAEANLFETLVEGVWATIH